MPSPAPAFGFNTPFAEQLEFFRAKLNLPSERWDDITRAAHDRAFIVAGAMKADLLTDLRGSIDKAIAEGRGIEAFRKDFRQIVQKHGWTGWTGEGTKAGEAWRTKVIYQTNMATSYAAGRWRQLNDPELLSVRPFWRYIHADGVLHPRPLHVSWNNLVLPHDHEFWKTHFPPNGWGCHCRVKAVRAPEEGDRTEPPEGWNNRNSKSELPGVDKGFDYAPGASADVPLRQMVQDKLITYPPAITKALSHEVTRYINANQSASAFAAEVLADRARTDPLWIGFVENFKEVSAAADRDVKGYLILLPADAPRHMDRAHRHDGGNQRPPWPADYDRVAEILNGGSVEPGHPGPDGLTRVVARKDFAGESYRAVFEVRHGKHNRALTLVSLVIKTAGGS